MSLECACIHYSNGRCKKKSDEVNTAWCFEGLCDVREPSNADRIRAMSDELLASQLVVVIEETIKALTDLDVPDAILNEVRSQLLERLKQPAEGDVNNG